MSEGQGILFVCLGNICRSPLVEVVARHEFERAGLDVPVDSCGTGDWHSGKGADPRSLRVAAEAGYDLSLHRARKLQQEDFSRWRWLLAMDVANLQEMRAHCPPPQHDRLGLLLEVAGVRMGGELPDPYYGDSGDFRAVLGLAKAGVRGLVARWHAI